MTSALIAQADCFRIPLPDKSVHCVVTSPPYWGLRKYSGNQGDEPLGLEPTPERHIERTVQWAREVYRVLRDDGVFWLNYGDCYSALGGHTVPEQDGRANRIIRQASKGRAPITQGNLMLMPHRIALALQADGWIVRQDLVWSKPNPMPESVAGWRWERQKKRVGFSEDLRKSATNKGSFNEIGGNVWERDAFEPEYEYGDDYELRRGSWRHTRAHEYVFMLVKGMGYWSNQEAVREAAEYGRRDQPAATWDRVGPDARRVAGATRGADPSAGRNPRSVLNIPIAPYKGAHYACVDDATEALTPDGWRGQDELQEGDVIAAYDPQTDELQWQSARFLRYQFEGELVAIEKRETSQRLTPNHRVLHKTRTDALHVSEASMALPSWRLPVAAARFRTEVGASPGEIAASLLGWYVTEGTERGRLCYIWQSISANEQHCETIRGLLSAIGADFREFSRNKISSFGQPSIEAKWSIRGPVAEWLQLHAPAKRIALRLVLSWGEGERRALLDAMIAGDGHTRSSGRQAFIQRDRETIDSVQALACSLGMRSTISQRLDGGWALTIGQRKWLSLRGTNGKHSPIGRESYEGTVWCPSVPSGFWLARRNGRPFITGNTFPSALIAPLILATCPRWCCPVCGQGWAPVVERVPTGATQKMADGWDTGDGAHGSIHRDGREQGETGIPIMASSVSGHRPTCDHPHTQAEAMTGIVCDPFVGSGTTVMVAKQLLRRGIGFDISLEYLDDQAKLRTGTGQPSHALDNLPLFST